MFSLLLKDLISDFILVNSSFVKLTLKIHNECGRVIMTLDSGSGVRGFQPEVPAPSRRIFFLCQIFFNYNSHDIFSILIFHKKRDRFFFLFSIIGKRVPTSAGVAYSNKCYNTYTGARQYSELSFRGVVMPSHSPLMTRQNCKSSTGQMM